MGEHVVCDSTHASEFVGAYYTRRFLLLVLLLLALSMLYIFYIYR